MPAYKRPTDSAICSYAREYHEYGSPCRAHTSMTFGVMPTRDDYNRAFDAVCSDESDGKFAFGNDPYVGTDRLSASETWRELESQLATWEAGEHDPECPSDGECRGEGCLSEDAGSWCSSVLGILGFEWI